jgi:hypothetical protein
VRGICSTVTTASGSQNFGKIGSRCATSSFFVAARAGLEHHRGDGALVPLRVAPREDRGLEHGGVGHEGVLQRHRGDPLAAGLHHVLGAVGDAHVPVGVERHHVARLEPPVGGELLRPLVAHVARGHPRAAHLELAHGLAVPGEDLALVVDVAHLDEGDG